MNESPEPAAPQPAPVATEPQPTRRRRLWRWFKKWGTRAALVGLVAFIVFVAYTVQVREQKRAEGTRELAEATASADADDPNWTWEKLNAARKRPPADKNGADVIHRFRLALPPGWGDGPPEPARGQPTVPALAPNQRVPARVLAEGEAALALVPEPLALVRSLRDTPTGFREYELERDVLSTKLPDVQYTRSAVWLLRWDAELAVEAGDKPRALVALRAQLNASRSVGDEPFLISQLVRMATRLNAARAVERALAHGQFADAGLADLQRAWAEDAEEAFLLNGLRGERASFYLLFGRLSDGTLTIQEAARERERTLDWYTNWLARGYFPSARAYQLRWFNEAIRVAKRPPHEQLPLPLPERDDSDPAKKVAHMVLPAAHKVAEASVRAIADARGTAAGLACERFRLKHGRFPDALAQLVPAFLPAVPLDAFTGEPLSYEKCEGGAIVFSVGQNRADGAGELDDPGPDFYSGNTVPRFRLYDPEQRHRPAPPEPAPEPDPNP